MRFDRESFMLLSCDDLDTPRGHRHLAVGIARGLLELRRAYLFQFEDEVK
jgi:hypothetical protein